MVKDTYKTHPYQHKLIIRRAQFKKLFEIRQLSMFTAKTISNWPQQTLDGAHVWNVEVWKMKEEVIQVLVSIL